MKVLYVLENTDGFTKTNKIGGYLSHVIGIVEGFQKAGYDIHMASYHPLPYMTNGKIPRIQLRRPKRSYPLINGFYNQYKLIHQVIKLIENESPDVVYFRWIGNLYFSKIKRKFPSVKIIIECNGFKGMRSEAINPIQKFIIRRQHMQYLRTATVISAITDEVRNQLLEKYPVAKKTNIIVNPNGVDVEKFKPQESDVRSQFGIHRDTIVIGFSGYFMPWHKIEDIIDATQDIDQDICLLLIGSGDPEYFSYLKSKAAKLNKNRIIFTGAIEFVRMPAYLAGCDILVVPQDKDNSFRSPIKLFEYMAMGKAIAAVNVGQMPHVIKDGVNGLLFEPDYRDLQRVLLSLVNNNTLREQLGKQARKDAVNLYTWEANIKRVMNELVRR